MTDLIAIRTVKQLFDEWAAECKIMRHYTGGLPSLTYLEVEFHDSRSRFTHCLKRTVERACAGKLFIWRGYG